jgi:hypothetical protein
VPRNMARPRRKPLERSQSLQDAESWRNLACMLYGQALWTPLIDPRTSPGRPPSLLSWRDLDEVSRTLSRALWAAENEASSWRRAFEEGLGLPNDPVKHTPDWCRKALVSLQKCAMRPADVHSTENLFNATPHLSDIA